MKLIRIKSGFTLVELLAVMVILAIILAIAVPSISGIISGSYAGIFAFENGDGSGGLGSGLEEVGFRPVVLVHKDL